MSKLIYVCMCLAPVVCWASPWGRVGASGPLTRRWLCKPVPGTPCRLRVPACRLPHGGLSPPGFPGTLMLRARARRLSPHSERGWAGPRPFLGSQSRAAWKRLPPTGCCFLLVSYLGSRLSILATGSLCILTELQTKNLQLECLLEI